MVLETIYETHNDETHNDETHNDETHQQQHPSKQILLQFQTTLNEHIYYHYYDDEIYEYFLEKIQHEYPISTNYQTCNHKTCPICNNPSNKIHYKHKKKQAIDYTQMQIIIENIVLEIEVLEIVQQNSCMKLYIHVNIWETETETETETENLHKIIHTNLEQLKKELIILTMK
jgi:hypothetical protein